MGKLGGTGKDRHPRRRIMRSIAMVLVGTVCAESGDWSNFTSSAEPVVFPKFKMQEIDNQPEDWLRPCSWPTFNGDKKPDIVVVDQLQVVWYENPTWKKHRDPRW